MTTFRDTMSGQNPINLSEFFDDFHSYAAADWTITTVEAGGGSATEALTPGVGGLLLITNDAADNDADFFQLPNESFKYVAGKRLYFGIRFKVSDATETDIVAGLQITDTTPLAVTDGIYFQKDDGDTNIDAHVTKDSTSTDATAIATLADDTFITLEFYYDGSTRANANIQLFVDGVRVSGMALTNVPDDEDLTVSFGIQNGEAVAKTMTIDWVRAFVER